MAPLQDYPKPLVDHQEVHKANIQRHKDAYAHQEEVGEHAEQVTTGERLQCTFWVMKQTPILFMGRLRCSAMVSHHTPPSGSCCKGSSVWLQAESGQAQEGIALL